MNGLEPLTTPRPWIMNMTWLNLAFLHWRVPAASLETFIPKGLRLETFDGSPWLGIVPFRMSRTRVRGMPPVPGTSDFLELNVRTYVTDGTRPGVWFFSLDCQNPLAVRGARTAFYLPYMDARMSETQSVNSDHSSLEYRSVRTHLGEPPAMFHARYGDGSPSFQTQPGSLEHWLTERYCLYSADRAGRVYRGEIRHAPWKLQTAHVELLENTMATPLGLRLPAKPDLAHVAAPLEVTAWLLTRV
jgi:uncharacterized protein